MAVQPIPEGYQSLIPYLAVDDAAKAIDFYKRAFGAEETVRMDAPGGKIGHAELKIGDSVLMLADPFPQANSKPPSQVGSTTSGMFMYVENVDEALRRAVDAGAELLMPAADMFWGDRFGSVTDPFGHNWQIATHVEDVPPEEMAERAKAAMASTA